MSRPYVNINSSNYNSTTDVVTLDITALRLRGQSTLTIGGFTSSQTISLSDGYYANSSFTFSAGRRSMLSKTRTNLRCPFSLIKSEMSCIHVLNS